MQIFFTFLTHQLKEKLRSPFWQKSVIINILLALLGLYFVLNLIFISLFSDKIVMKNYPDRDVIEVFTGLMIYYFAIDLIVRLLFQQLPKLSILPYLTLPIKKSRLLHYPILKSISSFFNWIAVLLFIPFFFKNIYFTQPLIYSLVWLGLVFSLIAINNFLNFSLKKYFSKHPLLSILFIACWGLLIYIDSINLLPFSKYYSSLFYYLAKNPFLIVFPISFAAFSYYLAYAFLKKNAYIEDSSNKKANSKSNLSFMNRYGIIGQLISLEIKMILRNKRPRSLIYTSLLFIFYGFMFYKEKNMDNDTILIISGLLIPSMFSMNYGQYLFSWESSYFDSILANKISPYNYLKSKYIVLIASNVIGYFLLLPFAYISYKIAFINAAFLLFNIGITYFILLFFCTFNTSYIDTGKSQFMNYQGTGVSHFLIIIPILGTPYLIHYLLTIFDYAHFYYFTIAIIGIVGIVLNKYALKVIEKQFVKRKYKMAFGFRKK